MSIVQDPPARTRAGVDALNRYPFWSPRFWHGMLLTDWFRLLAKNHFCVSPTRWAMAFLITQLAVFNSVCRQIQRVRHGKRIEQTPIVDPPIFIVGHWRSGTTLLHELMVLDEQFTFPTTFECMVPHHALVTHWLAKPFAWVLPKKRPMDNMPTGWEKPQEDEFALLNLGMGSPYRRMAFPNWPQGEEYLDMAVSPEEIERWQETMHWFLQMLTYRTPKRVVLKSPPHTGRLHVLLDQFPDAKIVHIVRDPYVVYASTLRLWKALWEPQALHLPRFEGLEEYVLEMFERMYASFERSRHRLRPNQFCELRYEDLVREPVAQMEMIYRQLELDGFETARPRIEAYFADKRDYKPNRHEIDADARARIAERWADFIHRYGYEPS